MMLRIFRWLHRGYRVILVPRQPIRPMVRASTGLHGLALHMFTAERRSALD